MNANVIGRVFHMRNQRDGMPAERLKVATYFGNAFSAERETAKPASFTFFTRLVVAASRCRVGPPTIGVAGLATRQ
jgi:hypothetical protein